MPFSLSLNGRPFAWALKSTRKRPWLCGWRVRSLIYFPSVVTSCSLMELLSSFFDPATEIMILFNFPKRKKESMRLRKYQNLTKGQPKINFVPSTENSWFDYHWGLRVLLYGHFLHLAWLPLKIESKSENNTEKMRFRIALSYIGLLKAENLTRTIVKIKVRGSHASSQNWEDFIYSSRNETGLPTTGFERGTSVGRLCQESLIRK